MADRAIARKITPVGTATLNIVTIYYTDDRWLAGVLHTQKGWHYYIGASHPRTGDMLSGIVKGPFASEREAMLEAIGEIYP